MELFIILKQLWRRRLWVLGVALLSIGVGVFVTYKVSLTPPSLSSRQYEVGTAAARALVDTPSSKVVDLETEGADFMALGPRAALLANLMAGSQVKDAVAKRVGLPASKIVAIPPVTDPGAPLPPEPPRTGHILTMRIDGEGLPIISIDAQAPDARSAARLANGAVAGLSDVVGSVAAAQDVPNARQLVVRQLAPARGIQVVRGPRRIYGLLAAIFTFLAGCTLVLVVSSLVRNWRHIDEPDDAPPYWATEPDTADEPDPRRSDDERFEGVFDGLADADADDQAELGDRRLVR